MGLTKVTYPMITAGVVYPVSFGAVRNGTTNDYQAITDAIADAASRNALCAVDLQGFDYATTQPIIIPKNVVLQNGTITYTGTTNNDAIVQIGYGATATLVRPAGVQNVKVKTASTATGLTGIRLHGLVRSCWVRDCYAEMNENATGTRNHVGFEIKSERLVTSSSSCYQNEISGCTAYNAKYGFWLHTEGTASEQLADPHSNGNNIDGFAYSCITSALLVEEGAMENNIKMRADTFPSQIGSGTTIYVFDIRGNKNNLLLEEEIGVRADTQYGLRLNSNAFWNNIAYRTQQTATGAILNQATNGRNAIQWLNPSQNLGGDLITFNNYTKSAAVASGVTNEVWDQWVAPGPCVVVRMAAKLDANVATSGSFFCYAAKNGSYTTSNRIEFAVGEGTTSKFLDGNPSAGTPIYSGFILDKGDVLNIAYTNSSPNAIRANLTVAVRFIQTD